MKFSILALALANCLVVAYGQRQFQCQSEGFFVDPNDCSKFVRCVDTWQTGRFQVYNFDCPDGKLINEDKSLMINLLKCNFNHN